jgi:hypothetical protein
MSSPTAPPDAPTRSRERSRFRSAVEGLLAPRTGTAPLEPGWAGPVVLVWAAGRALNVALLVVAWIAARLGGWSFGPDGDRVGDFLSFLSGWDAERYAQIASAGYPLELPVDATGAVQMNNWAFLPVFPLLERLLANLTGIPIPVAGMVVSLAASAGATLVLYALLRRVTTPRASWWAVVLFSLAPLSFVFVLGYAESLFLLLVFSALLLAVSRRYLLIAPVGVIAAFTRPGALALALALGILLAGRWMLRHTDPLRRREAAGLVVAGLLTAAAGLSWPIIADVVTGESGAYIETEMAWWVPFLGESHRIPFAPGLALGWVWLGAGGVAIVAAVVMAGFAWILSRPVRRMGLEVFAFLASYVLYLFAVLLPTQSLPRLLLPLAPLLADERLCATRRRRTAGVALCIGLQATAVFGLWVFTNP